MTTARATGNVLRIDMVFPRFKLLSGAERAILGLAGGLTAAGHQVRIICHQFDSSCRPRLPPGVELSCTNARLDWSRNRYLNALSDYARWFALRRLLDDRASLRLLFGPALPLVWYLQKVRRDRSPIVYYCWEPPRAVFQDRAMVLDRLGWLRVVIGPLMNAYAGVDRALVGLTAAVCTSSPYAARQIAVAYHRPAAVITLGVDRARLDAVKGQPRRQPPVVLSVNYLHPRKRVDMIVRAAAALRAAGADGGTAPHWVIVGDGPERSHLESLARELRVDGIVEFAGFVPDDDLPKYYAAASCYVHAAVEESFGLSVIEAAYCGCPVVAVDEGGVQDTVVDGVTGYRVPPTPVDLANGVKAVLGRDDTGRQLGAAGHDRICTTYRWDTGADDIVRLAEALSE